MEDINELCKLMQAKFGIESSELRQAIKEHKADCENVKDITEWIAIGGYNLAPGKSVSSLRLLNQVSKYVGAKYIL